MPGSDTPEAIRVRTAIPGDERFLDKIDEKFEWKPDVHRDAVQQGRVLVATVGGTEAGYLRHGSYLWDDRAPFIQMVQVHPDFRRVGVARTLMETYEEQSMALSDARLYAGIYSSLSEENEASRRLHESLGYIMVGTVPVMDQPAVEAVYFKHFPRFLAE